MFLFVNTKMTRAREASREEVHVPQEAVSSAQPKEASLRAEYDRQPGVTFVDGKDSRDALFTFQCFLR